MSEAASIRLGNAQNGQGWPTALRWSTLIGGGALAVLGLSRRSKAGLAAAAAGGLLAFAGTRISALPREIIARSSILVNCSPAQAYQFWRNLENLPRFMRHLESVVLLDENRSKWTAIGPLGTHISWYAETVTDHENELIGWRSLSDSDIAVDGIVKFSVAPGNRGTIIAPIIVYTPPAGKVGHTLARLLSKDPGFLMRQDLRRLKALIETGEIPTTEGQTHGPRSALAAAARLLDPDQPVRGSARIAETLDAKRRVS
jgi:uncharacterized membrane protein